ncbi:repeat element 32 [Diadegma semiclausum ichnovirus]|nr:repeat element 32 [Diadegma semiclausum ichnovirus]
MSELPGLVDPELPEIFVPMDIILHMGNYLNFQDYRSFVRSIWPDSNQSNTVLEKLWNLSTHKLQATFLNGKRLDVEYNFDPERMEEDRILINMDSLRPVFGGKSPPTRYQFASVFDLYEFVKEDVQLDVCSDHRYAACSCHLQHAGEEFYGVFAKPPVDECEHKHFHHYCWEHILSWFMNYLYTSILLKESKELFEQEIADQYAFFPEDIAYFQTGNVPPLNSSSSVHTKLIWPFMRLRCSRLHR